MTVNTGIDHKPWENMDVYEDYKIYSSQGSENSKLCCKGACTWKKSRRPAFFLQPAHHARNLECSFRGICSNCKIFHEIWYFRQDFSRNLQDFSRNSKIFQNARFGGESCVLERSNFSTFWKKFEHCSTKWVFRFRFVIPPHFGILNHRCTTDADFFFKCRRPYGKKNTNTPRISLRWTKSLFDLG